MEVPVGGGQPHRGRQVLVCRVQVSGRVVGLGASLEGLVHVWEGLRNKDNKIYLVVGFVNACMDK